VVLATARWQAGYGVQPRGAGLRFVAAMGNVTQREICQRRATRKGEWDVETVVSLAYVYFSTMVEFKVLSTVSGDLPRPRLAQTLSLTWTLYQIRGETRDLANMRAAVS